MRPQQASAHPFSLVCLGRIFGCRAWKGVKAPAKSLSSAAGGPAPGTPHVYLSRGSDPAKASLDDPGSAAAESRQAEDGLHGVTLLAGPLAAVLFAWEGPWAVPSAHTAALQRLPTAMCLELSLVGWCIQGGYSSLGTQPASPLPAMSFLR